MTGPGREGLQPPVEAPAVERPVTRDMVQRVAEAGYPTETHLTIGMVEGERILVTDGATMINTGLRARAERLEREADIIQGLSDLSDEARWQEVFAPRIADLREKAQVDRAQADEKEAFIKEHPQR